MSYLYSQGTAQRTLKGRSSRHVLHANPSLLPYSMFLLRVFSALVALLLLVSVRAEMNVTIDDKDPRISYQPAGVWTFLDDVRPSSSSRTADTGTHLYGRMMPRRIDWVRRHILQTRLGQQHLSPSLLSVFVHFRTGPLPTSRLQGAVYVYFVGYPIVPMSPPALIPMTLQPWHGSAITVESDAYRAPGTPAQIILFSSNRLDPTETYTLTVTKTNATLKNDLNIDAFILTQPDGAGSTSPPGIYISKSTFLSAFNTPL